MNVMWVPAKVTTLLQFIHTQFKSTQASTYPVNGPKYQKSVNTLTTTLQIHNNLNNVAKVYMRMLHLLNCMSSTNVTVITWVPAKLSKEMTHLQCIHAESNEHTYKYIILYSTEHRQGKHY